MLVCDIHHWTVLWVALELRVYMFVMIILSTARFDISSAERRTGKCGQAVDKWLTYALEHTRMLIALKSNET